LQAQFVDNNINSLDHERLSPMHETSAFARFSLDNDQVIRDDFALVPDNENLVDGNFYQFEAPLMMNRRSLSRASPTLSRKLHSRH
jgi:hypothetical protein